MELHSNLCSSIFKDVGLLEAVISYKKVLIVRHKSIVVSGRNLCMKKVLSIILCVSLCIMFSKPVLAASSSISKTIRLTTYNKTKLSFGSLTGTDIQITQVKIYINRSSGTEGSFVICLESPSGTIIKLKPSSGSVIYSTSNFNGENPKGTWYAWIEMDETASIQNVTVKSGAKRS